MPPALQWIDGSHFTLHTFGSHFVSADVSSAITKCCVQQPNSAIQLLSALDYIRVML